MRKILSVILCVVLVFSVCTMTSCEILTDLDGSQNQSELTKLANKTPEELYEDARDALQDATSFTVDTAQVITMEYMGESIVMNQGVITKINGLDSYVKTSNDMEPAAAMEVWYIDGIVYTIIAGNKLKSEITKEEFMENYMGEDAGESTLLDIPESWFLDIKFQREGDCWALNFNVNGEEYNELFANIGLGGSVTGSVIYKVYFDDNGNIKEVFTEFDMNISGVAAHCTSVSKVTVGEATITPPANPDDFTEVTLP